MLQPPSLAGTSASVAGIVTGRMKVSSKALVAAADAALSTPENSTPKPTTAMPSTASQATVDARVPSTISTAPITNSARYAPSRADWPPGKSANSSMATPPKLANRLSCGLPIRVPIASPTVTATAPARPMPAQQHQLRSTSEAPRTACLDGARLHLRNAQCLPSPHKDQAQRRLGGRRLPTSCQRQPAARARRKRLPSNPRTAHGHRKTTAPCSLEGRSPFFSHLFGLGQGTADRCRDTVCSVPHDIRAALAAWRLFTKASSDMLGEPCAALRLGGYIRVNRHVAQPPAYKVFGLVKGRLIDNRRKHQWQLIQCLEDAPHGVECALFAGHFVSPICWDRGGGFGAFSEHGVGHCVSLIGYHSGIARSDVAPVV